MVELIKLVGILVSARLEDRSAMGRDSVGLWLLGY